ncbi:MAG: thiamine-phosphate kinase [Pseudomonadota bacterium]|nr:thiamine-phosphate kinase [Pseudomonadota bacterium]
MAKTEFELIHHYFKPLSVPSEQVTLGIGDDAALCLPPPGMQLAISVDTLVAGVHFPQDTAPEDIGYKALAVNLSDMAAMGAKPAWFTLALTCPQIDEQWLAQFCQGMTTLAKLAEVSLIGGDTTQGPLAITIHIIGLLPQHQALRRGGAQAGEGIYVTGTLGDAGLGLASITQQLTLPPTAKTYVESRLNRPTPRWQEGQALRGLATSAIDISDGLFSDLEHILQENALGAAIFLSQLPLSSAMRELVTPEAAWELALTAGDDYELCFTLPVQQHAALAKALPMTVYTRIGTLETKPGVRCWLPEGQLWIPKRSGYQHFKE